MPTSSSGRESRRSSKSGSTGKDVYKSSERKEKSKSSQIYDGQRRGSRQAESGLGSASARPQLKGRTNSAPFIDGRSSEPSRRQDVGKREQRDFDRQASATARVGPRTAQDAQDEDEVAGVVGAVRHFQPFQSPEVWRTMLVLHAVKILT